MVPLGPSETTVRNNVLAGIFSLVNLIANSFFQGNLGEPILSYVFLMRAFF
jgi:hypothetical protein